MTPAEARARLLESNFFSIWQERHLIGGSEYKPGNPGAFDGIRFVITLVSTGMYTAKVIDFQGQEKELHPDIDIRDLANAQRKDLEWAVNAVLEELWNQLDSSSRGRSPNVPLGAVLEASREHPDATNEGELLTRLFMSTDAEKGYREGLSKLGYRVFASGDDCSEEALLDAYRGSDLSKVNWPQGGSPVISNREPRAIAAPSKNTVSYGRNRSSVSATEPGEVRDLMISRQRDFHWAPLTEKDSWPTVLRPISPFGHLSIPREMSTVVFMSAARQILDNAEEWLDLVFFSTEPVDGKVTACFLGSKADVSKRSKPQWLIELGNACERELWSVA